MARFGPYSELSYHNSTLAFAKASKGRGAPSSKAR